MKKEVFDLLHQLKKLDVEIELKNESNIKYNYPKGKINSEIISSIKKYKLEIIEYLKAVERIDHWRILDEDYSEKALVSIKPKIISNDSILKCDFIYEIKDKYEKKKYLISDVNLWLKLANEIAALGILEMFQALDIFKDYKKYTIKNIKEKSKPKNEKIVIKFLDILERNKFIMRDGEDFVLCKNEIIENVIDKKWEDFKIIDKKNNDNNLFYEYYKKSMDCLLELFRGKMDPIQLLFPNGDTKIAKSIYENNSLIRLGNNFVGEFIEALVSIKTPDKIKIIELGAGVGGTTKHILNKLDKKEYEYYFTDVSNFFINEFKKENDENKNIYYNILDINKLLFEQINTNEKFDVVVCSNVLHNAVDIEDSLNKLQFLLKEGGFFVILEQTENYDYLYTSLEFNMNFDKILDFRNETGNVLLHRNEWEKVFNSKDINLVSIFPDSESLKRMGITVYVGTFNKTYDIQDELIKTYFKINYDINNIEILENSKINYDYINNRVSSNDESSQRIEDFKTKDEYILLMEIWSRVLGITEVNENKGFYSLGGDSLILTKLISEIWNKIPKTKEWKWSDFMNVMENEFTPYELFSKIDMIGKKTSLLETNVQDIKLPHSEFVSYATNKEKCLYILFHDGTGGLSKYGNLINLFYEYGIEDRLYGIEYSEDSSDNENLHEILSRKYAKNIFNKFKDYSNIKFIGYCVGGSIAFETAEILMRVYDIKIKDVILIDSYLNAEFVLSKKQNSYIEKCMNSDYILSLLFSEILGNEMPMSLDKKVIKKYIDDTKKYDLGEPIQGLEKLNIFEKRYNGIEFKDIFYVMKKYFWAVSSHIPSKYSGKVTIIHGIQNTKNNFLEGEQDFNSSIDVWKYFLGSEFRYYALECNHFSILNNPKKLMSIIIGEHYE